MILASSTSLIRTFNKNQIISLLFCSLLLLHDHSYSVMAMSSVKVLLIDLSGTIHVGGNATRGAVEALDWVRKKGVTIKFLTNTTKDSKQQLLDKLVKIGFKLDKNELLTSVSVAIDEVIKRKLKPFLITEDSVIKEFHESYPDMIEGERDSVVVGLVPNKLNYENLNQGFRLLKNKPNAPLIAIHKGKYHQVEDGLSLGPGAFIAGLEFSTGKEAHICGKPNKNIFLQALGNFKPNEAIMFGDDVRDDIKGAQECGIKGCLVKSGKYREGDENAIDPKPNMVYETFADAVYDIFKDKPS